MNMDYNQGMSVNLLIWFAFIGAFLVIVLLHEAGHFILARLSGIEVEEFGIGFPPRVLRFWRSRGWLRVGRYRVEVPPNTDLPFNVRQALGKQVLVRMRREGETWHLLTIREPDSENVIESAAPRPQEGDQWELIAPLHEAHLGTEYTLNALPLGGFVRLAGENDPTIPGSFAAASPWKRLGVLAAGGMMNLILGVLVYTLIFLQSGIPLPQVYIEEVMPNSPAAQSGLQVGDRIVRINGQEIKSTTDARNLIYANLDRPVEIVVDRGGTLITLSAIPGSQRAEQGALGILMRQPTTRISTAEALLFGTAATGYFIYRMATLPSLWIQGQVSASEARPVGIRGIFDIFSQAVEKDVAEGAFSAPASPGESLPPPSYTLSLIAALTISIGLFNLLPIPALDGGRMLFAISEIVLRRRVPPELESKIHLAGFLLLLIFIAYINLMDFINPIQLQP
jgi:regulator of sigma E protease